MSTDPQPSNLTYNQQLQQKFGILIDDLKIESLHKEYLKSRWLDQVLWMEDRATQMRTWHRRSRLTVIVASAVVPILVALNFNEDKAFDKWLKVGAISISALVTVSSAFDEFNQFGDRWYSYRRSAELLKTHGWQFLQLSGSYRTYKTHAEAMLMFSERIEEIIQRDVEVYTTEAVKTRKRDDDEPEKPSDG